MTNRRALIFDWLLVLAWMAIIFAFSSQAHSGEVTRQYFGSFNILLRKTGHVSEFALLFLLLQRALKHTVGGALALTLTASVLTILYAVSDEYHQSFVPGRTSSIYDVAVDSAGIMLALLILRIRGYFLAAVKSCKS
ncbi:MAG: VanZ family protein [Candidatus Obscuribacterales bacterium]|nr:VanZ family protein [Candidatus Obscuribacterales bacterium]